MPVQVSYPGVYIQEVSSGVHTITGVSTSIAAFFGRTAKGPLNKAVRCLSYADFIREFGGPHPLSDLAQSVKQFFDNGGTDCYIVRIAQMPMGLTGQAAVTLRNMATAPANVRNVLTATAKAPGLWGQDIKLEVDYNTPNPDETFNLRASYESGGVVVTQESFSNLSMRPTSPRFAPAFVTQSSKLIDLGIHSDMLAPNPAGTDPALGTNYINLIGNTPAGYSQSRRVFTGPDAATLFTNMRNQFNTWFGAGLTRFNINLNDTQDIPIDLAGVSLAAALDINDIRDAIQTRINTTVQGILGGANDVLLTWDQLSAAGFSFVLRMTSNLAPFTSVRISRSNSGDIATPLMLGLDQGGIEVVRYSNMRPIPNGSFYAGGRNYGDFTDWIDDHFAVLAQSDINRITLTAPAAVNITLPLVTGGTSMYQQAASGLDGVREKLRIIVQSINADPNSPATAELWGYHIALKKKTGTLNDLMAVASSGPGANAADLGTGFVNNTKQYSLGAVGTSAFQIVPGVPGNDGIAPTMTEYVGDPLLHTGFYALDKVDLFNLMVLPGDREVSEATYLQIVGPASIYCTQKRAFLVLDAPSSWTNGDRPVATATEVNTFRALVVKDHSAVFYPKVVYSDAGLRKTIGPAGMIAGLMARTDSQRGVWKAPAGTEADLRGILDLEINLTDLENGVLNKLGVDCLRKFPTGIVNWGARTLDGSDDIGSEWKYIPIRRLALFLEESLYRGTQWVVFEPNDEPLWAKVRLNLRAFMMGLFREGAFQGSTPDKAFYVKCDGETTTQNDRNLGIVNVEVGFAPLKPAEFVVIKIQQIAGDLAG
jgi:phage tail sheath protein FI